MAPERLRLDSGFVFGVGRCPRGVQRPDSRLEAQAREARSSAQARNADGIASGIFEQRNNAGNGSALRTFGSARRNAGSATRYKAAGVGALRMALPAFAVLGVFAYLSYAFLAPISSLRFDNDAHASVLAEQQHTSVGFQLASSAEQLVPEQRSAGEPPAFIHAVAPAVPEPQSEGPILTANAKGNERTPQRQVPTKAGYVDIWGADAEACSAKSSPAQSLSAQSASNDHLPTVISEDGATAGDTFCGFEKVKLAGSSWQLLAQCSDGQERWTSAVRLTVKGDRLTWTSQRGNRTYRRCEQAMMLVTAPDK